MSRAPSNKITDDVARGNLHETNSAVRYLATKENEP